MGENRKLFTKRVIVRVCLVATLLLIIVHYNAPQHSPINVKIGAAVTLQSPRTVSRAPIPNRPVVVTAFSSNHFMEAQALFYSIHHYLPGYRIIAYDLGLNDNERERTKKYCKCDFRSLNYDRYPEHVRVPMTYAFKPMIINETVHEFGFVFWMDASVRLTSSNVESLWNLTRSVGFACGQDTHIVRCLTHPAMFVALNVSQPEMYERARAIQAAYLLFTIRPEIAENILAPWVQCAVNKQCIAPDGASPFGCQFQQSPSYCNCHRFDQSALEILLYRYFPGQFTFDPRTPLARLAPFSVGLYENLLPAYNVLEVKRDDVKDYFPAH